MEPGGIMPDVPAHGPDAPAAEADFARLVAEHHAAVFRYAFRLTGSEAEAEDLTQVSFIAAHRKGGQIREAGRARGWLLAVVRNAYFKDKRRRRPIAAANLDLDLNQFPEPPDDSLDIDQEALQAAINQLPDDFKVVLLMFYFERCSYKEIAGQLDLPPGTVMSRLSRAKSYLRARLSEARPPAGSPTISVGSNGAARSKSHVSAQDS
jgi:RNA polymerase sigma-70 factor (ECF subfamily)